MRCPTRSLDLSICDFWEYLKKNVFKNLSQILQELKDLTRDEITALPVRMYKNVAENFENRFHQCIAAGGHHIFDVILNT